MRNLLIVASMIGLLGFTPNAQAQDQAAQKDNSQQVPEAPQPQKKPSAAHTAPSGDRAPAAGQATSKQGPAKDDNPFPESVSRDAAKAASGVKPSTADDNPFPEAVSRDAAKAAGDPQPPASTPKPDLPSGVSSSQTGSDIGAADDQGTPAGNDPVRAKKDTDVGGFYLKTGNYNGALMRYQDATVSDPTNADAIFGLAEAQRALKKDAQAAQSYQLYLDIVPNGPHSKQALKALKTLGARN